MIKDSVSKARNAFKFAFAQLFQEKVSGVRGEIFMEMRDADGKLLDSFHKKNLIMKDASILLARLAKDPTDPPHGINMLAVGTGATGSTFSPDSADSDQRKLFAEIARKGFSSTVFRDSAGNAVAYPTNIVDFTATFGNGEAVGPLNEMGLLSTFSPNTSTQNLHPDTFPTRTESSTTAGMDMLFNAVTFSPISKPSLASLTFTWRITF